MKRHRSTYTRIPYNGALPFNGGHITDKQKPRQKPARENARPSIPQAGVDF